ncbi:MAG: YCF48-related protein [Patescibacteria group bacterium]
MNYTTKIRTAFISCLLFIGLLIVARGVYATGWIDATSPTTSSLYGLDCSALTVCIGVGDGGSVIYNTDRVSWFNGNSGVSIILHNVDVYSSSLAFAVGENATILKSTDDGMTWSNVYSTGLDPLYDVQMVTTKVGWAVGEDTLILKTTDGGSSWTDVSTLSIDARSVDATSTSVVWVAGTNGRIQLSTDGGTTWSDVPYATTNDFYTIDAISSSTAYVGGENGLLLKTTDSGATWTQITLSDFGLFETVTDIVMITSTVGTVVGDGGTVASTSDGTTFTEDTMASTLSGVNDVAAVAAGARFVVGASGGILVYDNYGPDAPENFVMDDGDYTNDTTPSFTWDTAVDDEGAEIVSYEIKIDSGSWEALPLVTSFTSTSTLAEGQHTVYVHAIDEVLNTGDDADVTFTIDLTDPVVSVLTPTTAKTGSSTQFVVETGDASSGVASCSLYLNASVVGAMSYDSVSGDYYYAHTFSASGSYSAYAQCYDNAGNDNTGTSVTVAVTGTKTTTATDTTAPSVGGVTPTSATQLTATTLSASYSDAVGVSSCTLYVEGASDGSMTLAGGVASKSYTFDSTGTHSVYVKCSDATGNTGTGSTTTVNVSAASTTSTSEDDEATETLTQNSLIKMACSGGEDVNDSCRAVYYYGEDGKRHAFPNEKVYFTWFDDFDDVNIVTDATMASASLGQNVTYHPGKKMVKFVTVRTVYAVGSDGELRAIDSEETAEALYGENWNQNVDDIADTFYGNYSFGVDIDDESDFDVDETIDDTDGIDDVI